MRDFNSKEYAWIDVTVVVLGVEIKTIRAVEYKSKRATEALYAAGKWARGIQRGRKEVEGTLTVLQSALCAITEAVNSIKEGDLYSEHALPFIACEVEYGI